jgi:galactose mutarotase-like enzyme
VNLKFETCSHSVHRCLGHENGVDLLWIQMSSRSCFVFIFTVHMHYLTTYNFCCSFEFRLRISLSKDGDLSLVSRIRNVNGKPFSFSFGYHTYISVSDIRLGHITSTVMYVSIYFNPFTQHKFCLVPHYLTASC